MRIKIFILTFLLIFSGKPVFASSIVLNEIMANPTDNTEWVELYNSSNQPIDLSNWKIKDGNNITTDDLTLSGQINPLSFQTFDHNKGWLNDSSNETVVLLDNNGQTIDSYTYSGTTKGKTYGRQPNGLNWIANLDPTKGSSNGGSSQTSSPFPTAQPTQIAQASQTPSNTPDNPTSFVTSNIPSQVNSDQSFSASVNLSLPNNPNTNFYLKGAFKKADGSNYFGLTKVSGEWIKNSSTYTSQYKITTDSSGNWSGNLEVQPDVDDSGFTGSGDYIFKVARYTSSGSGPTWSNEVTINITQTSQISNQDETSQQPSQPSLTYATKSTTASPKVTPETVSDKTSSSSKITYQIASIAGINSSSQSATQSGKVETRNKKSINPLVIAGLSLVFVGIGSLRYIYLKRIR